MTNATATAIRTIVARLTASAGDPACAATDMLNVAGELTTVLARGGLRAATRRALAGALAVLVDPLRHPRRQWRRCAVRQARGLVAGIA